MDFLVLLKDCDLIYKDRKGMKGVEACGYYVLCHSIYEVEKVFFYGLFGKESLVSCLIILFFSVSSHMELL